MSNKRDQKYIAKQIENAKFKIEQSIKYNTLPNITTRINDTEIFKEELNTLNSIYNNLIRLELLEQYLIKWQDQLQMDGVNSKGMVLNDIRYLLENKKQTQ